MITLKANIERAENGYIIHIYGEGSKQQTYIADDEKGIAELIKRHIGKER